MIYLWAFMIIGLAIVALAIDNRHGEPGKME